MQVLTLLHHGHGMFCLAARGSYIGRALTAMLSSSRAALGMVGRVAGLGLGVRITIAGMRLRVSAVGSLRSHYERGGRRNAKAKKL